MKFSHFFIERPVFAAVISIFIVIVGTLSYYDLPVSQYPDVVPPTIVVAASFPGASPEVVAKTVATPLEQEINGVENMLYMASQSTTSGRMTLTITFELGTDLDRAQVLVENRVAVAEPRLPEVVRRIGVTTTKRSPDLLMVAHLYSPADRYDQLYISNYAFLKVRDVLARVKGVGDVALFGSREYSMRIWLDPGRLSEVHLTAGDVVRALRAENVEVAAGTIGEPPLETERPFQASILTQGRLKTPEQFRNIVVKSHPGGRLVRVRDVARVELGALDYSRVSYLDKQNATAIGIFKRPGANAIATADRVLQTLEELSKEFPPGLKYTAIYNPTSFIKESMRAVRRTLLEAGVLVVLVIFIFLQSWRATIIPVITIPVSLIGTLALLEALGFSLNMLSLFGLVLAIGIVVDDTIVVVENVERNIEEGLKPKEAVHKAMDEVSRALVATTLALIAVFVPSSFFGGITGQFYSQFALTVAGSTTISMFVSLTLSPALCGVLLRPRDAESGWAARLYGMTLGKFFAGFNHVFSRSRNGYVFAVSRIIRMSSIALIIYVGLLGLTYWSFNQVPVGFIPAQDQGYLITSIQLPEGASLSRTEEVTLRAADIALKTPGIAHVVPIAGFSGATRAQSSNAAAIFVILANPFERARKGLLMPKILGELRRKFLQIPEARVVVIPPPPVRGIGTGGGFRMQVQDKADLGYDTLHKATMRLVAAANQEPGLTQVFSTYRVDSPRIFVDVDRTKARMLQVPLPRVFDALQIFLGSVFVNDFNFLGRVFRVTAQAESRFRDDPSDIKRLETRSETGRIVPLGAIVKVGERSGPSRIVRHNLYPAADVRGDTTERFSSGQAIAAMERLADKILPSGMGYAWTDLAFQQKKAGDIGIYLFFLSVLFVFLALSAQYESWLLPFAVILIVPMCLLFSLAGIAYRGMENNILTQIGFVVLVGLAAKNAILIVEFAKQAEDRGLDRFEAVEEACRLRLRPILMTAFAFILGVVPLLVSTGPGYEMRQAVGTAVFSGMLGVTLFGLLLTPVFYVVLRKVAGWAAGPRSEE
jgi:hydrophobe/amphiphile efflux-1 (HAE1) family protein